MTHKLRFLMTICLASVLMLATGCSYLHPSFKDTTGVDVTNAPPSAAPVQGQTASVQGQGDQYDKMVKTQSDDSVQLFSLDEPPATPAAAPGMTMPGMTTEEPPVQSGGPMPLIGADDMTMAPDSVPVASPLLAKGVPYAKDPDVEIFPFDDQTNVGNLPSTGDLMPSLPPPSSAEAGFASPFADNGWGADHGDSNKIYFGNGSSRVGASGEEVIDQVAANLGKNQLVRVEGHASKRAATRDPVKRHMVNLKISMQRAVKVSQDLIKKGVPAPDIKTTAWGDTQPPFLTEPGMDEEAASRRVEIFTQPQ